MTSNVLLRVACFYVFVFSLVLVFVVFSVFDFVFVAMYCRIASGDCMIGIAPWHQCSSTQGLESVPR